MARRRNRKATVKGDRVDNKKMARGKQGRREAEIIDTEEREFSKRNDSAWYAQNQQLMFDAASLPYAQPLGSPITLNPGVVGKNVQINDTNLEYIPGVCRIDFVPTVGRAVDNTSPINVAARNIYSYVRHVNSGHANYDAPDLMMYLIAMDSAMMYHAMMKRAYGVAQLYTPMNRYYPRVILQAMGLNPDDVFAHLAQLRYAVNVMGVKLGSLCVPASMAYFARHQWMCDGLYTDSDSVKAQTYFYQPRGFYQYDPTYLAENHSMLLKIFPISNALMTVDQLITYFNQLIDGLFQDEDFNIMSGDILKAFGSNGVIKIASISEDYMVLPSYNLEVLSQIQNSNTFGNLDESCLEVGYDPTATGQPIQQRIYAKYSGNNVPSTLTLDPSVTGVWAGFNVDGTQLITMYKDGVTPDDTMVATRLHVAGKSLLDTTLNTQIMELMAFGSEVVLDYRMYQNTHGGVSYNTACTGLQVVVSQANSLEAAIASLCDIMQFDYHPIVIPVLATLESQNWATAKALGWGVDLNNFTTIDLATLQRMHEVAMLSLLDVPQMAFNK